MHFCSPAHVFMCDIEALRISLIETMRIDSLGANEDSLGQHFPYNDLGA